MAKWKSNQYLKQCNNDTSLDKKDENLNFQHIILHFDVQSLNKEDASNKNFGRRYLTMFLNEMQQTAVKIVKQTNKQTQSNQKSKSYFKR